MDAGCGVGLQCMLLAEAVGPHGHVTGLDVSTAFLNRGEDLVKAAGLSERIAFLRGNVGDLPFENNAFDWAWSADCIGYGPLEPLPLIKELARVVKPGGIVAISGWSSEHLLPGYPRLEARLKATSGGLAPFVHGKNPETHFLRALSWFREAGTEAPDARTFADSFHSPLSPEIRDALMDLFMMRWPDGGSELSSEDQAEFRRVCQPQSPEFILNLSDYYAFVTQTLFWGKIPG
ncbi:hypothetical protein JCM14469_25130 [Desulfatiferula olefinivorans]